MHAQITTRNNKAISWNPYHSFSLSQFSQAMARWGWHRGESAESMTLIPRPVWEIFQEEYSYNNGNESIPGSRKLLRPISCQDTQQTERQICILSHGQIITCPAIARRNWIIWMWHLHSTISDFVITVWHLNNIFRNYQDMIAFSSFHAVARAITLSPPRNVKPKQASHCMLQLPLREGFQTVHLARG